MKHLMNKRIALLNLGCKVNSFETDGMRELLMGQGADIVEFTDVADIYIVNTCTVTNIADRKSRQMLHKAKQQNRAAVVVAVGCYAQAAGEKLLEDKAVDLVVGNSRKSDIVNCIADYIEAGNRNALSEMTFEKHYDEMSSGDNIEERCRAYVKIQDGCNQFCSYCIIPYVRGRVRSRSEKNIITDVEALVRRGYKEIVLTGIHISSYGLDRQKDSESEENDGLYEDSSSGIGVATAEGDNDIQAEYNDSANNTWQNTRLAQLINKLCRLDGLERIRLGSLEPRIITEDFVKNLAKEKKVCPHFHLSLQSGCYETLKRMNRKYTPQEYYDKCNIIRKYYDEPAIATDVIVGFPGEDEGEFAVTREYLKKVGFAQMHIFKYSRRAGTRADMMANQVSDCIKSTRSGILLKLSSELHDSYIRGFIGRTENVLIEECIVENSVKYAIGFNERYVRIAVKGDESMVNSIIPVKLQGILMDGILYGTPC